MDITAKQLENVRILVAKRSLDRARVAALVAVRTASEDPLNGFAVHKAVELKAIADGYERAMEEILGPLELLVGKE